MTRVATMVPYSECADAGLTPPTTSAPCNRFPCPADAVVWAVGEWGPCIDANSSTALTCGYGVQVRSVSCRRASGSDGGAVVDDSVCAAATTSGSVVSTRPTRQRECSMGPCGCTTSAGCGSDNEVCDSDSGSCVCGDGWAGADCSVVLLQPLDPERDCASNAVVDVNGTCCDDAAAVDSVTGLCCGSGAVVDGDGRCCEVGVAVDACGVCGGSGVVLDVQGTCCSHALAPSGLCCDGSLDSCGVCDGANECSAVVTASLPSGTDASLVAAAMGVPVGDVVVTFLSSS